MAAILPLQAPTSLPKPTLRVFHYLKNLPDDYLIWHHLAPWQPQAPDFLLVNEQGQALLVKVGLAGARQANPAQQLLLLGQAPAALGQAEQQACDTFLAALPQAAAQLAGQVGVLLLFPNLNARQLRRARPPDTDNGLLWGAAEYLKRGAAGRWAKAFRGAPLAEAQLGLLRRHFSPEAVVPPALSVRQAPERDLAAGLTDFLLDYDQERALKLDLDLQTDGQGLARDFRTNLVNGVAGSGKSLILLYRLRLLQALYPEKRFLVLTHNRPLIRDLESRYYRLTGTLPENIHWHTFLGWCHTHWPAQLPWRDPLTAQERSHLLQSIQAKHLADERLSLELLQSEFDWLQDQGIENEAAYLQAERRGRGFGLPAGQRQVVFAAFQAYQTALAAQGRSDWAGIPLQLWHFQQASRLQVEPYDVILVDEAQFFAPVWLELVQALLKPGSGHLFIAADPSQGFLRQGVSWRSLGLEVRGRSTHLKRSYRTTLEILNFATLFYRQRLSEGQREHEELAPDLLEMPAGQPPRLIQLSSAQDEITRLAEEVAAVVQRGTAKGDLLLLHANHLGVQALIRAIDRRLGRGAALDPKGSHPGDYIRVTTLNAGAGLEAPLVFLAGLRELFEAEQSIRLSEEDRQALMAANTRRLYMAATRAGQRLVFTYVGELPGDLKGLL